MSDERRGSEPGRRKEDYLRYCPEHSVRVEQSNERHATAEKRDAAICGKVSALQADVDHQIEGVRKMIDDLSKIIVGRWVFWVMVGVLFSSISFVGFQQNWAFKEMLENQREFKSDVSKLREAVQVVSEQAKTNSAQIDNLSSTMEVLSKRQDVLRDQNMQLLNRLGGTP